MRGIAYFLMFLAMLPAAFSAAPAAMMLWVWTTLAAPQAYIFGPLAGLPYNKIVVFVGVFALMIDRGRKRLYFDTYFVLLTLFMIQAALSFTFGLTATDRTYELADKAWKIYLLCLFAAATLQGRLQVHLLVIAICLGAGVHGIIEGIKFLLSGGGHIVVPSSVFGDNNSFGLFMLMTVPLLIYLRQYSAAPVVRLGTTAGVLLNLVGIVATGSRGAFIGMVAVTLAMIQQSRRKFVIIVTILAIAGGLAYVTPTRLYERADSIRSADQSDSFMSRVMSWKMNTLLALDRPLVGGGFSAMEDPKVFSRYIGQFGLLDILPTDVPVITRAAHSIYFEVLGDLGFSGLVLFLGILVSAFWNLRAVRRETFGRPALQWAFDLAGYLRLAMIAYAVSGAALSVAYSELAFVMFTLVSALRKIVSEEVIAKRPVSARSLTASRADEAGVIARL